MKKYLSFLMAVILASGCSTQGETGDVSNAAGTTVTAPENAKLSAFLDKLRTDDEFMRQINAVAAGEAVGGSQTIEACGDQALTEAWKARKGVPVIDSRDEISRGIEILKSIPATGSKFEARHLSEIEQLALKLDEMGSSDKFVLTDQDIAQLSKALADTGEEISYDAFRSGIVTTLMRGECEKMLPRYCTWSKAQVASGIERLSTASKLDALLTCDLVGWARELRLNYPKNDYAFDRFRQFMTDEAIVPRRVSAFVAELADSGPDKAFSRIQPPDEQYARLIAARKTYLDAIEAGGWTKVPDVPKKLEAQVGKSYAWVPALKQRLAQEGYTVGEPDTDVLDEQTRAAIELYRNLHQLNTKKLVDQTLVKNMAVPPETRLESIDLTIQRYRESTVGSLQYYVKVNVPDFYVEVWKDGERIARHKIVVGNNAVEKDPVTKKVVPDPETLYPLHPNRTPLQTSKINEVILNPYWNVPARIRQQELEPKLAENPNYYAENNYEEVNVDNPKLYYVRELPNPKNSLGRVKMMFPNPHNTYLHDTPAKAAFNNPMRALSHGCMRVQDPLGLAKLLLQNDGQYDEDKINGILRADPLVETSIMLNDPVDVDIVYFNTRVDDAGPVAFLSDVYEYDAVRLGKVVLKKLPKPKDWK